jgi:hypothetical protein
MSVEGHGRRFGIMPGCFSSASVSRPSADATAGLLSAKTAIDPELPFKTERWVAARDLP